MLDLLKEAASKEFWYNANDENYDSVTLKSGREYIEGRTNDGKEISPKECQIYLENIEALQLFPPHTDVYVDISWGFDSFYGEIYIDSGGLDSESKSFRIRYIGP